MYVVFKELLSPKASKAFSEPFPVQSASCLGRPYHTSANRCQPISQVNRSGLIRTRDPCHCEPFGSGLFRRCVVRLAIRRRSLGWVCSCGLPCLAPFLAGLTTRTFLSCNPKVKLLFVPTLFTQVRGCMYQAHTSWPNALDGLHRGVSAQKGGTYRGASTETALRAILRAWNYLG